MVEAKSLRKLLNENGTWAAHIWKFEQWFIEHNGEHKIFFLKKKQSLLRFLNKLSAYKLAHS